MDESPTSSQSREEPNSSSDSRGEGAQRIGDGPHGRPGALPYESPRDRAKREPALNVLGMTFACGIGFAFTAAGVLFLSAYLYMGVHRGVMSPNVSRYCAAVHFFLFAAVIFGVVRLSGMPGWREVSRWGILGMQLGAGVGMLVEGICFAAT